MTFKCSDVSISYGKNTILSNINFEIEKGERVAFIGRSGCGKSTLLRILANIEDSAKVTSGSLYIPKFDVRAYIDQKDTLLPWKTVFQNIVLPLTLKKVSKALREERGMELLKKFGFEDKKNYMPDMLSLGMRQKIILSRTLLTDSSIIWADEPFASLDILSRKSAGDFLLKVLGKRGLLFVTHDIDEAVRLCDRIIVFANVPSRIVYDSRDKNENVIKDIKNILMEDIF